MYTLNVINQKGQYNELVWTINQDDNPLPLMTKHFMCEFNKSVKGAVKITFVETGYEFKIREFTKFVDNIISGNKTEYAFDVSDGFDGIRFENNIITFEFRFYSSDLIVSLKLTDQERMQFARQFLNFNSMIIEYQKNLKETDIHKVVTLGELQQGLCHVVSPVVLL